MEPTVKIGYCESCADNTHHAQISAPLISRPHYWIMRRVVGGPWYCRQCRTQRWRLHRPLSASADGMVHDLDSEPAAENASVSAGNFIRGDGNLVARSQRASRFTPKFRASVVQRVLDGAQSLSQIAQELDVPQADLLVWVAEQFVQKQERIDQLTRTVEAMSDSGAQRFRLVQEPNLEKNSDADDMLAGGDGVIEGKVNLG